MRLPKGFNPLITEEDGLTTPPKDESPPPAYRSAASPAAPDITSAFFPLLSIEPRYIMSTSSPVFPFFTAFPPIAASTPPRFCEFAFPTVTGEPSLEAN